MDRFELFPIIDNAFNKTELQKLCFRLDVEYENLAGDTKTQKVLELIGYFVRRNEFEVLERAIRIARPNSFQDEIHPAIYKSELSFPFNDIKEALTAISKLASPESWPHFVITRPLNRGGWMGAESEVLIDIFYALYRPVVVYQLYQNEVERNFSLLDWRTRFQFLLLEFIGLSIFHDGKIAALDPSIEYTPRISGWRQLREENPQMFWWQGLSRDRLEKAIDAFCLSEARSTKRVMSMVEFRQYYIKVFKSSNVAAQQTLGLAANPLYGFTPATRPVYWRLLVIHSRLYNAILASRSESLKRPTNIEDLSIIFNQSYKSQFPFDAVHASVEDFESFETTFKASSQFLEYVVIPQTILKLNATQYRGH